MYTILFMITIKKGLNNLRAVHLETFCRKQHILSSSHSQQAIFVWYHKYVLWFTDVLYGATVMLHGFTDMLYGATDAFQAAYIMFSQY